MPVESIDNFQTVLPPRIRAYLTARGIDDETISLHSLGWNGTRITIPIFGRDGSIACLKLAKDPDDQSTTPKMLTSRGATAELYGWERVLAKPSRLVICEGEFDRLVLEAHGIAAVASTGGAGSFRPEWAPYFQSLPEVFLCFDRDTAGRAGMRRVAQLIPHAKIVELPEEVGPGGDVTDFFVRLGRTREDFLQLIATAAPIPVAPATLPVAVPPNWQRPMTDLAHRIAGAKTAVPIADLIQTYVPLRRSGASFRGLCPFHDDHQPSLMVYPETASFRCYGCGCHGDALTFLMTIDGVPFLTALAQLESLARDYAAAA